MRFRNPDFDIEMPTALIAYWSAWNEDDLAAIPDHLATAVTDDVIWNDPRDSFVGIDALEQNMRELKTAKPAYRFRIASEIDAHNDRLRYRWNMIKGHRTLMEGLDVVTLHRSGRIERVDGFFGDPTPLREDSGVPAQLRMPYNPPN